MKDLPFPETCFLTCSPWSYLTSTSTQLSHGKAKTNKVVFSTKDIVLIKVLRQEKGYDN